MFQNLIISNELSLYKFFKQLNFDLYLTKPQLEHLEGTMTAMILKGFNGKVSDIAELASKRHRTSITRFLSKSNWDENLLINALKSKVIELIWNKSEKSQKPIYLIIDDTISEKTKPSSKAINPIEKCYFHNSHLKRKTVYGHQLVVALLSCDGLVLPYSIEIYDKSNMSKIDIATKLIKSMPKPVNKGYILCDSWYSCKAIFKASALAGYAYIGALKTNRVIYPKGHERLGIKLHKFATSLNKDSFDLVKVKGKHYYIYNYIGHLNDMKNVSIILSYPKESFQKEGSLKAFISTDLVLKPLDILFKYTDRWVIEPFFRDCKNYLGLDSYQVRSERSILRYLTIMFITYTYCKLYSSKTLQFNTGLKLAKNNFKKAQIIFIYSAALNGQPIEKIFENLKIA
ncbi:IS701 family transposase (plasmid) [Clostridium botulinum]|uniref:IS701 family transposase n=4 Tax=Clostridium botulinum TaxID=1491 RepID=UPI0004DA78C0|nr:IS701 family transposase [Clostridium botulinum]KEH99875.1 transposase IS4 family protein [Clostridium botulinum C/D str. BKT75002]KOC51815.1 transposase [Clostridium botulinum]KOC53826.1 transposase [Clostridium botulinum]MCD3301289.1 IS701 family transposase [Clostridium botulinum D/C]MCD3364026.1 IS701 family transposase [Clostridium botulinum D/C]